MHALAVLSVIQGDGSQTRLFPALLSYGPLGGHEFYCGQDYESFVAAILQVAEISQIRAGPETQKAAAT
jgi:hypothetical protein